VSTVRELHGDTVAARDGVIGELRDVYFDDARWTARFFLVDEGPRHRLIPPRTVERGLSGPKKLRLGVTRAQLCALEVREPAVHLCSGMHVIGCAVQARDGPVGRVRDIVLDDATWEIREVVVDTRPWWPGRLAQVHPQYVERVDPRGRNVRVHLTREQVKLSGARTARR
jgi:hypothetical protein